MICTRFTGLLVFLMTVQFLYAADSQIELKTDADKINCHFGSQIAINLHLIKSKIKIKKKSNPEETIGPNN